jgi:hypothetical protein
MEDVDFHMQLAVQVNNVVLILIGVLEHREQNLLGALRMEKDKALENMMDVVNLIKEMIPNINITHYKMSLSIQQSSEFSAASVQFSKLRKNKNGGKAVYLNAGDNKKLYVQFPFMRSPYGLSAFTDEGTGRTSYSLDLSFDADNTEAMELHAKLKELDDIIVNEVAKNSKEWLGKEFNVAVLKEALYKPIVKPGKEQYAPTIKLKVLTKPDGTFVPECYSMQKEQVTLDSIDKGQKAMAIIDLNQIWFIDNKFGVTIRLQQALFEQSARLPAFAFQGLNLPEANEVVDDIEDDVDDEE